MVRTTRTCSTSKMNYTNIKWFSERCQIENLQFIFVCEADDNNKSGLILLFVSICALLSVNHCVDSIAKKANITNIAVPSSWCI